MLQESFTPKFHYRKPKKQAVKILWWCCGTNVSTVLKGYKLYSPVVAAIQIRRNKSIIMIKTRVDFASAPLLNFDVGVSRIATILIDVIVFDILLAAFIQTLKVHINYLL